MSDVTCRLACPGDAQTLAGELCILSALVSALARSRLLALACVTLAAFANAFACAALAAFANVLACVALPEQLSVPVGVMFLSVIGKDTGALGHTFCS